MSSLKRTVKRALEEIDDAADAEKTIVMKGPLAEIYTKALNIVYAKPDPVTNEVKMESQEQDQATEFAAMKQMASMLQTDTVVSDNEVATVSVYGVAKDDVSDQDVVAVTQELANPAQGAGRFVLVIDSTQNSPSDTDMNEQEHIVSLESTLTNMVLAHGGRVYTSLEEYARKR
jgi:hypothetical protein